MLHRFAHGAAECCVRIRRCVHVGGGITDIRVACRAFGAFKVRVWPLATSCNPRRPGLWAQSAERCGPGRAGWAGGVADSRAELGVPRKPPTRTAGTRLRCWIVAVRSPLLLQRRQRPLASDTQVCSHPAHWHREDCTRRTRARPGEELEFPPAGRSRPGPNRHQLECEYPGQWVRPGSKSSGGAKMVLDYGRRRSPPDIQRRYVHVCIT